MRYVVAIVFAILAAGAATLYVSSPVATWIVSRNVFESPDEADNLENLIFMGVNLLGLAVGWTFGWWLGGLISRPEKPL